MKKHRLSAMALLCFSSATLEVAEKEDTPTIVLDELIVTPSTLNLDTSSTTSSRLSLPVLSTPASIHVLDNSKMNYSVASDRVSEKPLLATILFFLIHVFKLVLNIFSNNFLIGIAYRFYEITLRPQFPPQKIAA